MKKILAITFLVLLIDQASKIYIKTHFNLDDSVSVFPGFKLTFVENPGMAYGFHFGGIIGKYFLVILRIFLIGGMVYMFRKWLKEGASNYLLIPMAVIFAGAIGNLIDGMFYGMIFDSGTIYDPSIDRWLGYGGTSKLVPFGHGYSTFMKGCVVDMLHFPLVDWYVPESWPLIGGKHLEFFKYIFNVADSAITVGAAFLLIFRKKAFPNGLEF
ncbi:lipoprotein signal peptidase [Chryseobacterium arthrosphaerae]|uniref:Lipoprotein signal peptidase n=1 Tax=Chryseobacterium arthrosphaerae TaxID=651561 RepID=A0A1B8ZB90_9FLAO|nr:lipoprotein signal peptidase [Chryseobacterium arthrosphaerae]MDG4650797.1 lipoprotein signal peptidase [Chryseobacterium arthrosphaerae]OCA68826.1 lipoprotein signal peptidase [Chryseobacterium arthrosphaerae]QUY54926.1 lipoprotein signal peptidase [Chryseobacterium arthrosphaerae]RTZ50130.1 lipoprotein signal peptidase [Chryseobacterium arthrosphaerae]UEQ74820.1 lipoprotein signal peptidase [Chryseobacterium arthrosphaerae]